MVQLSWYEQFTVAMALSFLTVLAGQTKNATAQAAIQSATVFLQSLLAGQVPTA